MMGYPTTFIHPIACSTASTTPSPPQFPHVEFTIATHIVACKDLDRFAGFQECKNPMLIVACKNPKLVPGFNKQRGLQPVDQKKKLKISQIGEVTLHQTIAKMQIETNPQPTELIGGWSKRLRSFLWKHITQFYTPFHFLGLRHQKKTKENGFWKFSVVFRATQRNKYLHPKVSWVVKCY